MNEQIVEAILEMTSRAKAANQDSGADKALKFSQAALNLAHAGSIIHGIEIQRQLHEEQKKKPVGAK